MNENDEEAYVQALSRLNAEYLTRKEDSKIPQLDLLISQGQWRIRWIERIQLEKAILAFEERNQEKLEALKKEIDDTTAQLLEQISQQDQIIKREIHREGKSRAVITGIAAFALGAVAQYARDLIGETQFGEGLSQTFWGQIVAAPHAKERITLIEPLWGEIPKLPQQGFVNINLGGKDFILHYAPGKE